MDAGDFSGGGPGQGEAATHCLLDAFRVMRYDAVVPGELELAGGVAAIRDAAKRMGRPFLASNLVDTATRHPLCDTLRVIRAGGIRFGPWMRGGLRIALLGVIGPDLLPGAPAGEAQALALTSPEDALRRMIERVRGKVDLVVVIAHVGRAGAEDLAARVPGIDLVIVGHGGFPLTSPETMGSTLVVEPLDLGRAVGDLNLTVRPGHGIASADGQSEDLVENVPEDAEMRKLVDHCAAKPAASPAAQAMPAAAPAGSAAPAAPVRYLGAEACRECHAAQYASWSRTPHARAFDILRTRGRTEDGSCTRCHTTGFGLGNGFRSFQWTPRMTNVQCEECHGPGSAHVARLRAAGAPQVKLRGELASGSGLNVCVRCHNHEQDPGFKHEAELKRGSHP